MKASGLSMGKIVGGVCAALPVVALALHHVVFPLLLPVSPGTGWTGGMRFGFTLFCLFAGALSCGICLLLLGGLRRGGETLQDVIDGMLMPVVVLDGERRFLLANGEAEKVLGLNRETDAGRPADAFLRYDGPAGSGFADGKSGRTIVTGGESRYRVLEAPVSGGRGSVLVLQDIREREKIRSMLRELDETMRVLGANSAKISGSAVSLSSGATRQAGSIAAISHSLDEFSKKIQGNTESASNSTKVAAQAREAAERSGREIAHALSAMTDVQDAGVRIARIVKLIDDVAFQTNLLALNASVEAARAGRQGKGFAVVAGEVRNLAGRSANAAKDTAAMVEDITERIGNAGAYISKLEEMLRNIVQDAIRMADSSAAASTTSAEQATAILQVNQELGQMNAVIHSTMSEAEQTAAAVETLSEQVEALRRRLGQLNADFGVDMKAATGTGTAVRRHGPPTINLTDEPPSPGAGYFGAPLSLSADLAKRYPSLYASSSEQVDMDRFEAPLKEAAPKWGGEEKRRKPEPDALNPFSTGLDVPEVRTPDGDRVVRSDQNIQLDDTEFGRY